MAAALHFDSHKTLGDLLPGLAAPQATLPVAGLAIDSRRVRAGDIFLAYPGESADGRLFVDQAIARGAIAVIAESGFERADLTVPVIRIPQLRDQVSHIADRFYDQPSAAMACCRRDRHQRQNQLHAIACAGVAPARQTVRCDRHARQFARRCRRS